MRASTRVRGGEGAAEAKGKGGRSVFPSRDGTLFFLDPTIPEHDLDT